MFNNFYDAWWFLHEHPMFQNEYNSSQLQECLDVYVTKVNPETLEIDDNDELNTRMRVWLEAGKYDNGIIWHDIALDCGADTYEEAIIIMANKVLKEYGNKNKWKSE